MLTGSVPFYACFRAPQTGKLSEEVKRQVGWQFDVHILVGRSGAIPHLRQYGIKHRGSCVSAGLAAAPCDWLGKRQRTENICNQVGLWGNCGHVLMALGAGTPAVVGRAEEQTKGGNGYAQLPPTSEVRGPVRPYTQTGWQSLLTVASFSSYRSKLPFKWRGS